MFDIIKSVVDGYKVSQVETALLKDEYQQERDYIIEAIKECLKKQDYTTAWGIVDKYRGVASDDEIFCVLAKETKDKYDANEAYNKQLMELSKLKTLLEVTPVDDYQKRYELCVGILEKEPENSSCQNELARCEKALGLRPVVSDDLRLGRIVNKKLFGYVESKELKIPEGNANIRLHTHGVSIKHSNGIYRIHYSQIISMEYNSEGNVSNFLAMAAGAALGYFLGGGLLDALDGAATGSDLVQSSDMLNVLFWDIKSDSRKLISIRCQGKSQIDMFINNYNYEISITKKTRRKPKSEENVIGKVVLAICLIVIFLLMVSTCFSSNETSNKSKDRYSPKVVPQNSTNSPSAAQSVTANQPAASWVSDGSMCSINKSGTVLTVSGKSAADASVEISGVETDSCKTVSVIFDKNVPKTIKCSMIGQNNIKLSTDQKFIKRMRDSNKMTVNIPLEGGVKEQYEYSLNGFSKACSWTK